MIVKLTSELEISERFTTAISGISVKKVTKLVYKTIGLRQGVHFFSAETLVVHRMTYLSISLLYICNRR